MPAVTTDRIEKKILLRASRARVWRALTDSGEFGTWFGVKFDGPFTPGALQVANGIMLTVTESGFDRIPLARRAKAFTANEQGWTMVVKPSSSTRATSPVWNQTRPVSSHRSA